MTTNVIASGYSGSDMPAKIRACISNSVATLGTTMVLLGGDDTVVPTRGCYANADGTIETNMPTDLYYSGLSGSWNADGDAQYGETSDSVDMAWDVVVGRLPVRTAAQATNYLNKVMTYESGSPVTNKIILGGPEAWSTYTGTGRPSDDVTIDGHAGFRSTSPAHTSVSDSEMWLRRLYRDGIRSYWPASVNIICDTITSWDSSTCGDHSESAANTLAAFNRNHTHLMFSGHGAPQEWGLESGSFSSTSASSMTGMAAFVYTDACLTGAFDGQPSITVDEGTSDEYTYTSEPCLAEGFLRNTRPLGGAVAYMGCARYGWGEPDETPASNTSDGGPSTVYAYKFYKRIYQTNGVTLGVAFAMHKADMVSSCSSDGSERWIQFGLNLLGDPALKMPTDEDSPSAPVFGANPGPVAATSGVARSFTVSASGSPAPVLALQSTTASSGYSFTAGTGVLAYTPPVADVGTRTFTFRATNTEGVATQTVSVVVAEAPPGAPASVWASATNTTDFTAAWSAASGATGYRLDVATNSSFSTGGGGSGTNLLDEDFSSLTDTAVPSGWATSGSSDLDYTGAGYYGEASPSYKFKTTGQWLTSPTVATGATNLQFWALGNGGSGSTLAISGLVSSAWTLVDTITIADGGASYNVPLVPQTTKIGFYFTRSYNCALDDVIVQSSAGEPSYVAGYSNRTMAGTSQSVTGLTAGATYHFRVRAVNGGGTSANSSVANVTTLSTLSAPVFGANPGPVAATAGVARAFTVSATGVPAPVLALTGQTASGGYSFNAGTGELTYTPPQADAGARTFAFSASNSQGTAAQTVTVNVTAATSPAFTGGAGPYATTAGVAVAFTVSASGTPAPTLALAGQTASGGYSFTPSSGAFSYTPPGADVGTRTFTFTAANAAGTVTQVTSVTVSETPTAPGAPASVWASATNTTDFTAAWSAASGATSYRLDVATNATFSGGGGVGGIITIFRETMGSVSATTTIAAHETADGFDNDGYTMSAGGAANASDIRATSTSSGYADPAGNSASGLGNVWFTSTSAEYGFGVAGIDASGYDYLMVSFGYRKESGTANATLAVQWSTNAGAAWNSVTVSNLPAAGAATGWYMVSNLYLPTEACRAGLSLRWLKTGATAMRLDDILLQGHSSGSAAPAYVAGYSNRTVAGTSQSVTGLVAQTAYYFRVRAVNGVGTSGNSATANVTTAASGGGGTPPVVNAIPPRHAAAGGSLDYTVTATATDGDPILSYGCTSAVDTNTWDIDGGSGYFLFYPTAAQVGTAVFSFTAADKDGTSSPVAMTVTVNSVAATNSFQEWVEEQWQDPGNPDFAPGEDADGDGMTTEEEYVADTDPNDPGEVLSLAGSYVTATTAGENTGEIRFSFPASTGRYYQMEACTDLTNHVVEVDNLGWGNPDGNGRMTVTNATTGTWYGVIRALLDVP